MVAVIIFWKIKKNLDFFIKRQFFQTPILDSPLFSFVLPRKNHEKLFCLNSKIVLFQKKRVRRKKREEKEERDHKGKEKREERRKEKGKKEKKRTINLKIQEEKKYQLN